MHFQKGNMKEFFYSLFITISPKPASLQALHTLHSLTMNLWCPFAVADIYMVTTTENKVQPPFILNNEELFIYCMPILIYEAAGSARNG